MKKIGPARQQQQQQLLPVMWRKKNAISHSRSLDHLSKSLALECSFNEFG